MTELNAAEQQILRQYRMTVRRKHLEWIKELEAHGYTVTCPEPTKEEIEVSLTPNQTDLLSALRECSDPLQGMTAADMRAYVRKTTGRDLPRGTTGTALISLQGRGLIVRHEIKGSAYYRVK